MCSTSRKDDSKSCDFDGLVKCMEDKAAAKLQGCFAKIQDTEDSTFKLVNDWLRVLVADTHDVFAADIVS